MTVAVLTFAGVLDAELGLAVSVLSLCGGEGAARTVARSRASVLTAGGQVTTPFVQFAALEPPGGVFVPGGAGAARAARDPLVRAFLRAQFARGVPVAASGSGVLALGEAGLLAGRAVSVSADLRGMVLAYDPAEVRAADVTVDGEVITAPGGLGALHAAARLAARLWGQRLADEATGRLTMGA